MDYRKFYEEKCNIKIPVGYEIHHIDEDRNNNDIRNLVMLPSKLHHDYHAIKQEMKLFDINFNVTSILDNGSAINNISNILYERFIQVIKECNKYANYRDYLLGLIPNIHNFVE